MGQRSATVCRSWFIRIIMAMLVLFSCPKRVAPWPLSSSSSSLLSSRRLAPFLHYYKTQQGRSLSSSSSRVKSLAKYRLRGVMEAFPSTKLSSSSSSPNNNDNNNNNNEDFPLPVFTKTAIRKMKNTELRTALSMRGMSSIGRRHALVTRLLMASRDVDNVDDDGNNTNDIKNDDDANNNNGNDAITTTATTTETTPTLDPTKVYRLQTKGHTTQNSSGAGIGLVLLKHNNGNENSDNDNNADADDANDADDADDDNNKNTRPTTRTIDTGEDDVLWQGRIYVSGNRTGFEAEYSAAIMGIQYVAEVMGARKLLVQLSHDAVVYQLNGFYDINKRSLKIMLEVMQETSAILDECTFEDITATENNLATGLAQKALATRKSVNILPLLSEDSSLSSSSSSSSDNGENGNDGLKDPIDTLKEQMDNISRYSSADDPAHHEVIDPARDYLLRFDGGSRGNPGIAGAGMVIYDDKGQEIWCGWKYYEEAATNNVAEYLGLVYGLKCVNSFGIKKLIVEGDSQLIVRHLTGEYQCRAESLQVFYESAKELAQELEYFEIRHIPRAENSRADWLANHAMDLRESHGFDEIE